MEISPTAKFVLAVLVILFLGIGAYRLIAYETMAYEIRKEDERLKQEARRIGQEKMRQDSASRAAAP